jgi:hypothetical protein
MHVFQIQLSSIEYKLYLMYFLPCNLYSQCCKIDSHNTYPYEAAPPCNQRSILTPNMEIGLFRQFRFSFFLQRKHFFSEK